MSNWNLPLQQGSTGPDVGELHDILLRLDPVLLHLNPALADPPDPNQLNPNPPPADFIFFGPNTKRAVAAFQVDHGIVASTTAPGAGVVDWVTEQFLRWADDLREFHAVGFRDLYPRDPGHEFVGADVRDLRNWINPWWKAVIGNGNDLPEDRNNATYGDHTSRAVEEFKKAFGLSSTPVANPQTIQVLYRERHALTGNRAIRITGRVTHTNSNTPLAGYRIRAFAVAGSHEYLLKEADQLTDQNGRFTITGRLPMRPPASPATMPIILRACHGDFGFSDPGWTTNLSTTNASPTVNIAFSDYTIGGAAVHRIGGEDQPAEGVTIQAFSLTVDSGSKKVTRSLVGQADTDRYGSFHITWQPGSPPPELVVRAVEDPNASPVSVLAESPAIFNLQPVEFSTKLTLPHPGETNFPIPVTPAPTEFEFDNLVDRFASEDAIMELADALWELPGTEREKTLRHTTGDLFVTALAPKRPELGQVRFDIAAIEYNERVRQTIRENAVRVEKVIRSHALAELANARLDQTKGFRTDLLVTNEAELELSVDVERYEDGTPPEIKKVFSAKCFYVLLPDTSLDLSHEEALELCVHKRTHELRQALENAGAERVIQLTDEERRDLVIGLVELKSEIEETFEWNARIPLPTADAPTGHDKLDADEIIALSEWISLRKQSPNTWAGKVPSPGKEKLEWRSLTFNLHDLEQSLRRAISSSSPQNATIAELANLDDSQITAVLSADPLWKKWPSRFQVEEGDKEKSTGLFLEFIRSVVPFGPTSANDQDLELLDLCFRRNDLTQAIRNLNFQNGGGTQPVSAPAHLRRVSDLDADDGNGGTLAGLLPSLKTLAATGNAWQTWPDAVRESDADSSAKALFFHIRFREPSPATAVLRFLDQSPSFRFGVSDLQEAIDSATFHQACKGDEDYLKTEAEAILREIEDSLEEENDPTPTPSSPAPPIPVNDGHDLKDFRFLAHRSPHGPAAYAADLYQSLGTTLQNELKSADRRGDIKKIKLTRENTETLVPEIDLVNELLEAVASAAPPDALETTGTNDERRALPEHSTPSSSSDCWARMKQTNAPLPLPYDRDLDVVRSTLETAGSSRFALLETFLVDVSTRRLSEIHREPPIELLARESLELSAEEFKLLSRPHSDFPLWSLYGFPDGTGNTQVIAGLNPLEKFLDHTLLCREDLEAIIANAPTWLNLAIDETDGVASLKQIGNGGILEDLTAPILQRFHRFLRLNRLLAAPLGVGEFSHPALGRTTQILEALNYYTKSNDNWQISKQFLLELEALRRLWTLLGNPDGNRWDSPDGGLAFPAMTVDQQIAFLDSLIPIDSEVDAGEAWAVFQGLCGVALTSGNDKVRKALRLAEIAKRVEASNFRITELAGYFGNPDVTPVVPTEEELFRQMSEEFRNYYAENRVEDASESTVRKLLLDRLGYEEATANKIVSALSFMISRNTEIGPEAFNFAQASTTYSDVLPPFRLQQIPGSTQRELYLSRPVSEEELVSAMDFRITLTNRQAFEHAAKAKRNLAKKPLEQLEAMAPLIPNIREAKAVIFSPDLNEQFGWNYVQHQIEGAIEVPVRHFCRLLFPRNPDSESARKVAERLLNQISAVTLPAALWEKARQHLELPNRLWAHFLPARGTGLDCVMQSIPQFQPALGGTPVERVDGDLTFVDEDQKGTPYGWRRYTPDVYHLPVRRPRFDDFLGTPGNSKGRGALKEISTETWRVAGFKCRWEGQFFVDSTTESSERRKIWIRSNYHPESYNRIRVRIDGNAVISLTEGQTDAMGSLELDGGFHRIDVDFFELGGFYRRNVMPWEEIPEEAKAKLDIRICLTDASQSQVPPDGDFGRFESHTLFQAEANTPHPLGIAEYRIAHAELWPICSFCGKAGLLPREVEAFAIPLAPQPVGVAGAALGGWDPRPASVTPVDPKVPDEFFDLSVISEPPSGNSAAAIKRRRSLFDLWENITDLVEFRESLVGRGVFPNSLDASEQLIAVCGHAYKTDGDWSTGAITAPKKRDLEILLGIEAGHLDDPALIYVDDAQAGTERKLKAFDLRNTRWIDRVLRSHQLLQVLGEPIGGLGKWQAVVRDPADTVQKDKMLAWAEAALVPARQQELPAAEWPLSGLTDQLRIRGRRSLLAYLRFERAVGGGGSVGDEKSADLSRRLLIDVECDPDPLITRLDSAISSLQRFVRENQVDGSLSLPAAATEIGTYMQWLHARLIEAYPENTLSIRTDDLKTAAYRQLEFSLRRDRLSYLKSGNRPAGILKWLEDTEGFYELASRPPAPEQAGTPIEPQFGWLVGDRDADPDRGWQPGPAHMNKAMVHHTDDRQWLFWTVPVAAYDEKIRDRPYSAPDQSGQAGAEIEEKEAVRLGWSWKRSGDSEWEPSRLSEDWIIVPDSGNVPLIIRENGDTLTVQCSGASSFVVPVPESDRSVIPVIGNTRDPAGFLPAWYGGLSSPNQYVDVAGGEAPIIDEEIAPSIPEPAEPGTQDPPAFGFSNDEIAFHSPALIASHLAEHRQYETARRWLANALEAISWLDSDDQNKDLRLRDFDCLLSWAEDLLREGTDEAVNQASALLLHLQELLGPRPLPVDDGDAAMGTIETPEPQKKKPQNPRLISVWDRMESALAKSSRKLNSSGRVAPQLLGWSDFFLPANPSALPPHPINGHDSAYRFTFLIQRALDLSNEVKSLGSALLAAIEKDDAEHLNLLRSAHEANIAQLIRDTHKLRWEEAETQWRVLRQNRFNTEFRKRFYEELVRGGLSGGERSHLSLMESADGLTLGAQAIEIAAQTITLIPDSTVGTAGWASSPVSVFSVPGGNKISKMMQLIAQAIHTLASFQRAKASEELTKAGYARRRREWEHQRDAAGHEIKWLERQIDGARQRMTLSKRELDQQERQFDHSRRLLEYARRKFSGTDLYDWMRKELLALHEQAYRLAEEAALQAQTAFHRERGYSLQEFIQPKAWDSPKEGLLAGDRLSVALRHMEKAFHDGNTRSLELTKHFSLRQLAPFSLVSLLTTGSCEVAIPEWLFDLDYPGHFLRRLKNVTLSLPCALGPYQTVNCTLTHLGSRIRVDPAIGDPCGELDRGVTDSRWVRSHAAASSVATTSAQNDAGLFELNFRDERLLPFEGHGAESRWRIDLPSDSNWFDLGSLSDAVLHLRYTARDSGEPLRSAAALNAAEQLPSLDRPGLKLIHLRHDFPGEWHKILQGDRACVDLGDAESFQWARRGNQIQLLGLHFVLCFEDDLSPDARIRLTQFHATEDNGGIEVPLFESGWSDHCLYGVSNLAATGAREWGIRVHSTGTPADLFLLVSYANT